MARRKAAWLWVHSIRMSRSQASAQRRRQRLTCRRDSPTSVAISELARFSKAKRTMAARCRSCDEAVGALRIVLEDVLLTFGDGHLGRPTRHGESLPDGCEASESG